MVQSSRMTSKLPCHTAVVTFSTKRFLEYHLLHNFQQLGLLNACGQILFWTHLLSLAHIIYVPAQLSHSFTDLVNIHSTCPQDTKIGVILKSIYVCTSILSYVLYPLFIHYQIQNSYLVLLVLNFRWNMWVAMYT